jgi:hypothetical protein
LSPRRIFADDELVELLGDQSDLLAIADAIASVGRGERSEEAADGEDAAAYVSGGRKPVSDRPVRRFMGRPVLAFVAAVVAFVVLTAPALALSQTLRELVGLSHTQRSPQLIVARLISVNVHPAPRFAPPLATVTFTVGQVGRPPGTGIPDGSVIDVQFVGRDASGPLVKAYGRDGRYRATLRTPEGGIRNILIGGFLNSVKTPVANGDFWIPIVNVYAPDL